MQGPEEAQATGWCLERAREPVRSRGRGKLTAASRLVSAIPAWKILTLLN